MVGVVPVLERLGRLFVFGFRGLTLPVWLRDFAEVHGLGGVVLFDYDCATRAYGRNVSDPQQLRQLCRELASLPARPLIFVDQEGGRVRRLKTECGFQPYPAAAEFNTLPDEEKISSTRRCFAELRELGIHYNLAPVIDINSNPDNPDLGRQQRTWSAVADDIVHNAMLVSRVAREVKLGLCVKHFPGIGGSTVNSHAELMDLSATLCEVQLELFYRLGVEMPGEAILLSHGYVKQWDMRYPVSLSAAAVARLRQHCPSSLLITDDLQMQGLRHSFSADEAVMAAMRAGVDMLLLGNNLLLEEERAFAWVQQIQALLAKDMQQQVRVKASLARIEHRKSCFYLP